MFGNRVFPLDHQEFLKSCLHSFSEHKPVRETVCSCHVTYMFQSESTVYSCLNVKEHLGRSRREIWRLSECNWTQTQSHLVRKWTLKQLAKWLSVRLRTRWGACGFEFSCSQWERLSWKTGYAMILGNNTKWVSSKPFLCGRAKPGPLGRRIYYY